MAMFYPDGSPVELITPSAFPPSFPRDLDEPGPLAGADERVRWLVETGRLMTGINVGLVRTSAVSPAGPAPSSWIGKGVVASLNGRPEDMRAWEVVLGRIDQASGYLPSNYDPALAPPITTANQLPIPALYRARISWGDGRAVQEATCDWPFQGARLVVAGSSVQVQVSTPSINVNPADEGRLPVFSASLSPASPRGHSGNRLTVTYTEPSQNTGVGATSTYPPIPAFARSFVMFNPNAIATMAFHVNQIDSSGNILATLLVPIAASDIAQRYMEIPLHPNAVQLQVVTDSATITTSVGFMYYLDL